MNLVIRILNKITGKFNDVKVSPNVTDIEIAKSAMLAMSTVLDSKYQLVLIEMDELTEEPIDEHYCI